MNCAYHIRSRFYCPSLISSELLFSFWCLRLIVSPSSRNLDWWNNRSGHSASQDVSRLEGFGLHNQEQQVAHHPMTLQWRECGQLPLDQTSQQILSSDPLQLVSYLWLVKERQMVSQAGKQILQRGNKHNRGFLPLVLYLRPLLICHRPHISINHMI